MRRRVAGNGTGKILQGLTLGAVTIAAGAAIGYYVIGGAHPGQTGGTTAGVQETGTPPDAAPQTHPSMPHLKPARANSDYTAPGAPRIHIVEAKTLTLGSPSRPPAAAHSSSDTTGTTDIPTPDAEASQEATKAASRTNENSATTTTSTTAPSVGASPDAEASQAATPAVPGSSSPPPVTAPSTSDTPPVKHNAPAPPSSDSEASQAGDTGGGAKSGGAALYRIQAGTFADAKNAHDYLGTLQGRGYDASLHADHQGGQTVYHVQVGAYHDRAAAEDAAAGFRHNGVSVTISPISP